MKIIRQEIKTDVGDIVLASYEDKLVMADWKYRKMRTSIDSRISKGLNAEFIDGSSPVIETCKTQLEEYLNGHRKTFDLSLNLVGTPFQVSVWNQLQKIPFGETRTYLQLSKDLGNELAIRAVSSANGANAISIIVPCHRVIGSNGDLVGYAGGLPVKKKLLKLENSLDSSQLELFE